MNITEFAKCAGVSKSAVSRYFNGGYLADDKKEKIKKAIAEIGYSPTATTQSIRPRATHMIGVILPKLSSESAAKVMEGITEFLNEKGYEVFLAHTGGNFYKEIEYLDLFRQNRVDGVILLASVFTEQHQEMIQKIRIPVVIVGQNFKGYHCVCHDDMGAAYALTKHMIENGSQFPGYIGVTTEDRAAGKARRDGFMKALEEAEIEIPVEHTAVAAFSIESGYKMAKHILSFAMTPDSLFCATDSIAAGAMQYCLEIGMKIPKDMMICGIGDSKIGRITAVPLTTAHFHYVTTGREAARLIYGLIQKRDSTPKIMQLDFQLELRASTNRKVQENDNIQ
ncbi:MAG: LacI family DNA-binding transcriptional regulator [Ruminococcus sp.]|nr:LacI family DNA-binding transcriptional regulator [Ruminococcus sp.]